MELQEIETGLPVVQPLVKVVEKALIPNILTPTDSLNVVYPQAIEFTNQQLKVFWLPEEVKVEKDIQDILVNMSKAEKHGVITTLKLFTLYELKAGSEYWGGRFKRRFPTHELQRMASTFAMFELAIHKPFYSKINELLFLDNDEFYKSYENDPVLKGRMDFIDKIVSSKDDLLSLAGFSLVEGGILYSAFAFLKHFQSQGKNRILNIVRGINFSVRDENLHSIAGAWTFKALREELRKLSDPEKFVLYMQDLESKVYEMCAELYEHECYIVDLIFSEGPIDGITATQLKNFVMSRIDEVLVEMGFKKLYDPKYNPIKKWFYDSINSFTFNDTFSGIGNSYHRSWDESAFVITLDGTELELPETDDEE
jgi:ribonucleoside-diphosphate reductase beta chain